MGRKNRDFRRDGIRRDDGDLGDPVYLTRSARNLWGTEGSYHEDPDCHMVQNDVPLDVPMRRAVAQDEEISPCRFCVLDEWNKSGGPKTDLEKAIERGDVPERWLGRYYTDGPGQKLIQSRAADGEAADAGRAD